MGRLKKYLHISCAVNPAAAREREMALTPAVTPKRVAVLGGGVAGCEAARVLALRGHRPEIFERTQRLGGNLHPASAPDFRRTSASSSPGMKNRYLTGRYRSTSGPTSPPRRCHKASTPIWWPPVPGR